MDNVYEGVTLRDLQELEKHIQRTILFHPKGMEVHNKVKEIYENDSGINIRTQKQPTIKSDIELMREKKGYGTYDNKIRLYGT